MTPAATTLYAEALTRAAATSPPMYLRFRDGTRVSMCGAVRRWSGALDDVDQSIIARASGAVLDVGCGPGRFVGALTGQRRVALGVDIVETAVRIARRTGSAVLHRSVFDRLPGEGRWGTVLLMDGNIGIDGDPVRLLIRCRELLAPGGSVLVELGPPNGNVRLDEVRLETGAQTSLWFSWATVPVDAIGALAVDAGLAVRDRWNRGDRWFAELTR